jgi:hypothetical protein
MSARASRARKKAEEIGEWHGGEGDTRHGLEVCRNARGCLVGEEHCAEQSARYAARDEDGCERATKQRRGRSPALSKDDRYAGSDRDTGVSLCVHQRRVEIHLVAYEQEVARAGATTDVADVHEHEHQDLKNDRGEIGAADEQSFECRVEPAVRESEHEMREHRVGNQGCCEPDRERQGSIRFGKRAGEQYESRADHESAGPPFRTARPRGEPRDDERDAGHDRERGVRGALVA